MQIERFSDDFSRLISCFGFVNRRPEPGCRAGTAVPSPSSARAGGERRRPRAAPEHARARRGEERGTHRARGHRSFAVCSRAHREAPPLPPAGTAAAAARRGRGLTRQHRDPPAPRRAPRVGQGGCQHRPSTPPAPMPAHGCRRAPGSSPNRAPFLRGEREREMGAKVSGSASPDFFCRGKGIVAPYRGRRCGLQPIASLCPRFPVSQHRLPFKKK